jgi:hypothetical protein
LNAYVKVHARVIIICPYQAREIWSEPLQVDKKLSDAISRRKYIMA